jgi:hypothetical protein
VPRGLPFSEFFRESMKDPEIRGLYSRLVEEEFSRFFATVAPPSAAKAPLDFSSPIEDLIAAVQESPNGFALALKTEAGDEVARWVKGEGTDLRDFLQNTGILVADGVGGGTFGESPDVLTLLRRAQDMGLSLSLSSLDERGELTAHFFLAPDEPIEKGPPRPEGPSLEM